MPEQLGPYSTELSELREQLEKVHVSQGSIEAWQTNMDELAATQKVESEGFLSALRKIEEATEELKSKSSNLENKDWVALSSSISKNDEKLTSLAKQVEDISMNPPALGVTPRLVSEGSGIGWISQRLSLVENKGRILEHKLVDQPDFLTHFLNCCASDGISYSGTTLEIFHSMVMGSQICRVDDGDLLNCWVKSLGWGNSYFQVSASPIWSDPECWLEEQEHLFGDTKEPAIVAIFDFDKGLVDAYLQPVLRIWSQFDAFDPTKKLFLISSRRGAAENRDSLETPIVHLDRFSAIENQDSEQRAGTVLNHAVSPESFIGWSQGGSISSLGHIDSKGLDIVSRLEVIAPRSLTRLVGRVGYHLSKYFEETTVQQLSSELVVLPWLQATQSEDIVSRYEEFY